MNSPIEQIQVLAIAAMANNRVIGDQGKIPWHLPEDLKHFSELTTGHTVLMGRKTFQSLPPRFCPLPGRFNVVASRQGFTAPEGVKVVFSAKDFVSAVLRGEEKIASNKLWIIGGGEIYSETKSYWSEVYLTVLDKEVSGDAIMPEFETEYDLKESDQRTGFKFLHYIRRSD